MRVDKRILKRLDDMLVLGQQVLDTFSPGRMVPNKPFMIPSSLDMRLANQWFTSCLSLLSRVFGESSEYYRNMRNHYSNDINHSTVQEAFGVLLSAKDDYESESIFELRTLIEAELFDDFLEQANYLFSAGYHAPSAVIAGSVLEDGLRKLCAREQIPLPKNPKLDLMNAELVKAGVYNKLAQKKITTLADIRNSAAHGKWNEFGSSDVKDMLSKVRAFMEEYFR